MNGIGWLSSPSPQRVVHKESSVDTLACTHMQSFSCAKFSNVSTNIGVKNHKEYTHKTYKRRTHWLWCSARTAVCESQHAHVVCITDILSSTIKTLSFSKCFAYTSCHVDRDEMKAVKDQLSLTLGVVHSYMPHAYNMHVVRCHNQCHLLTVGVPCFCVVRCNGCKVLLVLAIGCVGWSTSG